MPREITAFFEAYRGAFNALNGAAVADLYAEPSGIAQGGAYTHWPSREPVRENMEALCRLYQDKGFIAADFETANFVSQSEQYAFADLRWRITWDQGKEPWCFNTSYNLVRTPEGWKVLLCTAYTEDKLVQAEIAA
jgi:ketosteroid isomerase-like protein